MKPRWWIFAVALTASLVALGIAAVHGPDPFPTHWNGAGRPDQWSTRTNAVLLLAVLAVGIPCLLALGARFVHRIPARAINTPRRAEWSNPAARPRFDALVADFLLTVAVAVLALAAGTALITTFGGSMVLLAITIWVVLGVIFAGLVRMIWGLLHPPQT